MTFELFYISVAVLIGAMLIGAIVLWILEAKFNKKYPANQAESDIEKSSVNVTGEKVFLQVENGLVTVVDALPTVEVEAGEPQIQYVEKIVEKIVEKPVIEYVEKIVEKPVIEYVDRPVEDADVPADMEDIDTANLVSFERNENKRLTFADKLAELDKADLDRYHKLVNYVLSKPNAKHNITNNMAIFKIRTTRMMVASIKRGIVTLQFSLGDSNLERFVRAEGAQIKVPTVTIRLTDDVALENAKKTADITIEHLETEREYHKDLKREQRREQRAKARELAAQQAAADDASDAQ